MSDSYSARVPAVIGDYTRRHWHTEEHPIVTAEFRDGVGWRTTGYRKRVSLAWVAKLRRQGVRYIAVSVGERSADFSVSEVLRIGVGR